LEIGNYLFLWKSQAMAAGHGACIAIFAEAKHRRAASWVNLNLKPTSSEQMMNEKSGLGSMVGVSPVKPSRSGLKVEFSADVSFQTELHRRVYAHLENIGQPRHGTWRMFLKAFIILSCYGIVYALLVFFARTFLQALVLAVALGYCMTGIGFCVQHDGGHNSFAKRRWVNKLMAMTLDLVGGSSYVWHWKHTVIHHSYVNITGYDTDIELSPWGRLTPHQKWYPHHRWQHLYLWLLYGLLSIRWQLFDDFKYVIIQGIGKHELPRPRGWELALFIAGKSVFFAMAFAIPMLFHPVWTVLFFYAVVTVVLGSTLSVVFQLPHVVGQAEFPLPDPATGRMANARAVHQAQVTLDYGTGNPVLSWVLGGLNYHVEHHLFPTVCHIHYPAIAPIVEQTCREFGVKYAHHPSFFTGLASHYRWLREMGKQPQPLQNS
jgi:linoleoyl-CoA desaturase